MNAALRVEALKLSRSPVGVIGTLALLIGTLALLGGLTMGLAGGNPELTAQAEFSGVAATLDWDGLLGFSAQITTAGSLLGFGVVLSWMFGREFTDGTITGLFALPVTLNRIALAKFAVYALWVILVSLILVLGLLGLGFLFSYGVPSPYTWAGLVRQLVLTMLSGALAVPVALIATVTRSLLAAIGGAIALVITGQVGAIAGAGGWMPLVAPALWAMSGGGDVTLTQLSLTVAVALVFVVLACVSWSRLQLDR